MTKQTPASTGCHPKRNRSEKLTTSDLIEKVMNKEMKKKEERMAARRRKHRDEMRLFRARKKMMLESQRIKTIHATQGTTYQAVPNVRFIYKSQEEDKEYAEKTIEEKNNIAMELSEKCSNGNNKKQRPQGLYFTGDCLRSDVYIVEENHDIYISNELEYEGRTGKHLSISIRYLNCKNKTVEEFVNGARGLAQTWEKEKNMTNRNVISGTMKHFGTMMGAGGKVRFSYKATKHNKKNVNLWHRAVNVAARTIAKHHFKEAFKDITEVMNFHSISIPSELGGNEGLSCEMVQSQHALVTEPHFDQDCSKCISIWTVEQGKELNTKGWYFVLPKLTCTVEGRVYSGIAVKLRHGTGIEWDGRCVSHCSTSPNDNTINVHGTFFGITRI
jgi:hypothetical protein